MSLPMALKSFLHKTESANVPQINGGVPVRDIGDSFITFRPKILELYINSESAIRL